MLSSSIGNAVRSARNHLGLTQIEVARRAGVSRLTVLRLEGGGDASISLDKLNHILDVLDLELAVVPAGTAWLTLDGMAAADAEASPIARDDDRGQAARAINEQISEEILQGMKLGGELANSRHGDRLASGGEGDAA